MDNLDSLKKKMMQQIINAGDPMVEEDAFLEYGPVKVTKGKYKGRIGCYDDDKGQSAYVYWGDMASVLDTGVLIRKAYLSNQITTYDLVSRSLYLQNTISLLRCRQQDKDAVIDTYKEITELYGEYVYVTELLNKVYEDTFYLQGEGEKKVFLSHSSADKQLALYIASDLKRAKFNVWFDKWDLQLGHSIPREIGKGLEMADTLLMLVSKDYLESAFCNDEWEAFYMRYNSEGRKIISVIIDESEPPAILSGKMYYRLKDMSDYDNMLRELKRVLKE